MFGRNALKKIQPQLQELRKQMIEVSSMNNKVESIIRLFQVISPLEDAGGFIETINKLKSKKKRLALTIIQEHITKAGRRPYGKNRTRKGEQVTADNVFLGDINGIWTKPASYWLARQEGGDWNCISYQAENFVKSHVHDIVKQIDILQS